MEFSTLFKGLAVSSLSVVLTMATFGPRRAQAQIQPDTTQMPWTNKALSADQRADMVLGRMTLDEKIQLVHGTGWGVLRKGDPVPARSNFGAGYVPGID